MPDKHVPRAEYLFGGFKKCTPGDPTTTFLLSSPKLLLGSLSKKVFERRTSIGNEAFPFKNSLTLSNSYCYCFYTLVETTHLKSWAKPLPRNEKSPLLVVVHYSKTSLLKPSIDGNS